jgi:alcohol dehydrogenase (NADP+)
MSKYDQYTGFQVKSPDTWTEFHKQQFDVKPFEDHDVEIKIECCGVCASDIHTISGGWGDQLFPLAVGHGKKNAAASYSPQCWACC